MQQTETISCNVMSVNARKGAPVPGSRLTAEERSRIEGWLREGLGYAEIGRRLGRPTSTVSREVMRNGVPGDYRAEDAARAAGDRGRKRRPRTAPEPDVDAQARSFVEEFAALLAATGLPRMTARVFVCLLTAEGEGLTAADLVRLLRVSPASVSKSVAALEAMDLVARSPVAGSRRERYFVAEDVWARAWQADTGAHGRVAAAAERGVAVFGADTPAGARLAATGAFFAKLSDQMGTGALAVVDDALTMVAALVHAARPLPLDALAGALGWPADRTRAALEAVGRHPDIADPLALTTDANGHALAARPDRLSREQREALGR
jgi:hypothetical protein